MLSVRCLSGCHIGPGDFVLNGNPALPPQKGVGAPSKEFFSVHVYCGQTAGWMKLVLGMEVGLSPGDFVLDGDPVPFPKKGAETPAHFSAHFYCGQTARCIKMPLGMDVGLSPGDFLLDGAPVLPPQQRGRRLGALSQFSAHFYCVQTDGCINMPLGMEVGLTRASLC